MGKVLDEIETYVGIEDSEDGLQHYGIKRRSGRYPWGSGDDPYQHGSRDFLSRVEELKKSGWKETPENIKKEFDMTTKEYRNEKSWANYGRRLDQVQTAKRLRDKEGLGATEIGRKMGIPESTVRSLLNPKSEEKMKAAANTVDFLKKQVKEKGMIDVGSGVELELKISRTNLDQALYCLDKEGYSVYKGGIPQVTNKGQQTNQIVLCPPGTQYKDIYDFSKVKTITDYVSNDRGDNFDKKFTYPASLDSKRLKIRYAEDGGLEKDGLIELRRNVQDLDLQGSRYAQVRIMVDGKKYIKGMAIYSDDMPKGVDVVFNTNKTKKNSKMDVLKPIKDDPDNPFGSLIKDADQGGQYWYNDKKTGERKLGLINKARDEGDWAKWQDTLSSQFLAKQSLSMAKKQLNIAKADKYYEYEEICKLTNPTIKKHLLQKFSDNCDSAAVELKAASLPGQKYHVILPINSLKDTEVYAPNYKDGSKLALVRYPHGGIFEIPILTVNNKNQEAIKIMGKTSPDAIGITKKNADKLSGADFDGDFVMTLPTHDRMGKVKITNLTPAKDSPLKSLETFDAKIEYHETPGMKYMKDPITEKDNTQKQMGIISNLITDMTLGGATEDELARAVKHSMVVIDAAKHKLDYKRSEKENRIDELKRTYQRKYDEDGNLVSYGGSATIISKASGDHTVLKRQGTPKINMKGTKNYDPSKPEGAYIYKTADDVEYKVKKIDKHTGKEITETRYRTQRSTNMAEVDDAYKLVSKSRYPMELLYADYANNMKSLANQARKEMMNTGRLKYDKNAKLKYKAEVDSLMDKLRTAEINKTRERAALRTANVIVNKKKELDPNMSKSDLRKVSQQALTKSREDVASVSRKTRNIKLTDNEWKAVQAGAISENVLKRILDNADIDELRQRATPRATRTLSPATISRIQAMSASYTLQQIANKLNVPLSTVSQYAKKGGK